MRVTEAGSGRVIIIAGKSHTPFVIAACASLNAVDKKRVVLIPEPQAKNTAPAIACAAVWSRANGGRTMLVLTSDHIIKPLAVFKRNAAAAVEFAERGNLAVFGIAPSRPETGYGYIKTARQLAEGVYAVAEFVEKPDFATAKKYAASKRFFWNSGMFAFDNDFLINEFNRLAPDVIRPFAKLAAPNAQMYTKTKGLKVLDKWAGLENAYRKTVNISFDYAIAVQCGQTVMVRAAFDWIDVGSWDEYARLSAEAGASTAGDGVFTDAAKGCFVDSDIPVAIAGVDDLIVVIRTGKDGSPCAALIAKKGETQRVRNIVEQIKKSGKKELL